MKIVSAINENFGHRLFLMLNTLEHVYGLCINFFFATQLTMF